MDLPVIIGATYVLTVFFLVSILIADLLYGYFDPRGENRKLGSVSTTEIKQEFLKSKIGLAGIGILIALVSISIIAAVIFPVETFQQWNNPQSWISYPKTSIPSWVNLFMFEKIPEHKIFR